MKSKRFQQPNIFPSEPPKELLELALFYCGKYCIKYGQNKKQSYSIPPAPKKAEFHNVDIKGLELNDVRYFDTEHLVKQTLNKLK